VNGCHRSRKYYDVVILLTLISTTFTPIFSMKMEDTLDTNANVNGCHRPLNFLLEKAVVLTSPKGGEIFNIFIVLHFYEKKRVESRD
jgi:hypothetical protein